MSQLEMALRKARAEANDEEFDGTAPSRPLPNAAFVSAWTFDDAAAGARKSAASQAEPLAVPQQRELRQPQASRFRDFSQLVRNKLVIGPEAMPDLREEFGKIAAILYRLRETRPVRVVMVVSAIPGEGKSLTSLNLSLTLSEAYKSRVLLVDADLRRPTIHGLLDMQNGAGLKEALTSTASGSLPTERVTPNLEVLTAGSASVDPMGALISDRMHQILSGTVNAFDWVVLDTPPVTLIPDAHILAGMADAAILVVESGSTKCELARQAVEIIGRERMLGVVLNKMPKRTGSGKYGYYGHYAER